MFTGIVECTGVVSANNRVGTGNLLTISKPGFFKNTKTGGSIAVNGVCLTLVKKTDASAWFEVGPETLLKTNLSELVPGSVVNLEKPVGPDSDFSGHFVQGHVDTTAKILDIQDSGGWKTFWFQLPPSIKNLLAPKGSICIDGISLTLVDVKQKKFSVALIPHTLKITTLGQRTPGDMVNLEADMLAKYALNACKPFLKQHKA